MKIERQDVVEKLEALLKGEVVVLTEKREDGLFLRFPGGQEFFVRVENA